MIKLIHKYNKVVTYVFLFVAICFMFSGLGLDILQGGADGNQYAIKVNDKRVSPQEFARTRENLTDRYRSMFGDNFEAMAKSFNLNITQQAVDSTIDSTLLEQEAARWKFAGSEEAVNEFILTKVFAGREVSQESIRAMLQNAGMNYKQFSAEIKREASREAFTNILRDVSFVGDREVEAQFVNQETVFSVLVANVRPEDFISQVPNPSEEELKKLYNTTATTYEVPARVSYEYVTFDPKDFEKDVPVRPQDLEFYYTENPAQFKTPEQARIRSITLLYPKESDPSAMAAVKTKAKDVHAEAISGKPFVELVQKYSDDLPTKMAGGDKGWVQKGSREKNFDKAVFNTTAGNVADIIETDYGFEIVKVEERKEAGQKQFSEVKASIEAQIRTREAPSYAAAKAQELISAAKKGPIPLSEAAANLKLPAPKSATLSQQGQDPDPLLKGLTQKALQIPSSDRLIATTVDMGDTTIALQIKEFKEPTVQPFEAVKEQVLQQYQRSEANKLAEKAAQELLDAANKDPKSLSSAAAAKNYKVVGPFDISRAKPSSEALPGLPQDLGADAMSIAFTPRALSKVYRGADGYLVAVAANVVRPDLKSASAAQNIKNYRQQAAQSSNQRMLRSVLALLKSKSEIDVDRSLVGADS
jgi:peptidyl-prolyl cis-trans isomerase D